MFEACTIPKFPRQLHYTGSLQIDLRAIMICPAASLWLLLVSWVSPALRAMAMTNDPSRADTVAQDVGDSFLFACILFF
jgi:hypothetical protein